MRSHLRGVADELRLDCDPEADEAAVGVGDAQVGRLVREHRVACRAHRRERLGRCRFRRRRRRRCCRPCRRYRRVAGASN
eukprot:2845964-Pleurochrysis_carterae.AAC.1